MAAERGTWSSRSGFILAAAGSAVGLGNIWRFPAQVGQGGGGTFVVVYLACVLFICCPIMVAELAIGRRGQQSPVGSFAKLCPGTRWWLVGALGVLAGAGILSFYSVIAGWTVAYILVHRYWRRGGRPTDYRRVFCELYGERAAHHWTGSPRPHSNRWNDPRWRASRDRAIHQSAHTIPHRPTSLAGHPGTHPARCRRGARLLFSAPICPASLTSACSVQHSGRHSSL